MSINLFRLWCCKRIGNASASIQNYSWLYGSYSLWWYLISLYVGLVSMLDIRLQMTLIQVSHNLVCPLRTYQFPLNVGSNICTKHARNIQKLYKIGQLIWTLWLNKMLALRQASGRYNVLQQLSATISISINLPCSLILIFSWWQMLSNYHISVVLFLLLIFLFK